MLPLPAFIAAPSSALGAFFSRTVQYLLERLLLLCFGLWLPYAAGWFHRVLRWTAEREATQLLNGCRVTVGSLQTDLLRGRGWASNVILHAPQAETWRWEAPVLARVGKVYVECNLVQCLFFLWFYREEIPVELYTVYLSDIQVFVERKHNIYNFFLLDPHVILPDLTVQQLEKEQQQNNAANDNEEMNTTMEGNDSAPSESGHNYSATSESNLPDNNNNNEEEQAQQVVDDMLSAVRRAAQEGDNWHGALFHHYRHTLTDQLKALTTKKKSVAMQEGVNLLKHVTANITEKSATAQQIVVPARRSLPGERPVYGRVGRVLLQDLRIFLKADNSSSSSSNDAAAASSTDTTGNSAACWNKPIVIEKVAVRASEFCPPLSAKDTGTGTTTPPWCPALYQSLDVYLEVVWKRVLAEIAKSNTGRFLQTAIGEAADVFFTSQKNKPQQRQQQQRRSSMPQATSAPEG